MHTKKANLTSSKVKLTITASEPDLLEYKNLVLKKISGSVKIAGFRDGTAPINLVEKHANQEQLQTEFLDLAMSELYTKAAQNEKIHPVSRPEVQIKKFVPFTSLEFEVTTDILGNVNLPNYKTINATKAKVAISEKDIQAVIKNLQTRMAERSEVTRASKVGDEVWIDFSGKDAKGEPVSGADGKDYPLVLGSKTFIPGFEENLVGMKPSQEKTFTLTFPKEYGLKALANKKVTFTTTVKKVQEIKEPKVDDEFAKKCGPFASVDQLKKDIKSQLSAEREAEALRDQQNQIVSKIVDKSTIALPSSLVEQQIAQNLEELKRNLVYRGQTYEEFLKLDNTNDDEYRKKVLTPQAERQLKTSIVLNEIAEKEHLSVTPEELEIRLQLLRGQYASDVKMQEELNNSRNQQDISQRMLTEKVLELLTK